MATHVPFRSWCPFCVAGKAVSDPHQKKMEGPGSVPVISIDYAFMGLGQHEDDGSQNPILVMEDDTTKVITAHMMPRKGPDEYATSRIAQDIRGLGYRKIILKSDQEPAIVALKDSVSAATGIEVIPEESPVGESQSNGRVERAVRTVKGQIRTMKEAVDSRFQDRIAGHHPVLSWLPRHAAASIVRYNIGKDGRTAHERWKGKKFKREVAEFGECVWYLKPRSRGATGVMGRWSDGVWLGIREESGEAMIGTKDGLMRTRTIRRKASHEQRWNKAKLDEVTATPWNVGKETQRDEDIKIEVPGRKKR